MPRSFSCIALCCSGEMLGPGERWGGMFVPTWWPLVLLYRGALLSVVSTAVRRVRCDSVCFALLCAAVLPLCCRLGGESVCVAWTCGGVFSTSRAGGAAA